MLIWGCTTFFGPGDLARIRGTLDSEFFLNVLNANSPDLSIIEHVWGYVKYKLAQEQAPRSMDDLWERVQDIWTTLPEGYLHDLY
ncbi:MAG: hypothetical protein JOS17DRAFT_787819 [Linnemannia elongata]|nr:MAG: hypothetical protein JOS17DRAFT_787819 [Linnemannia elongata]